uniref:Uncharacterized protein n=1 Tax=Rhizophagus irregularis (strain DAOM 181602 / DAOM 197198 / MUCL 43194) TaxID=747089 RepID=U9T069_RHIID
MNILASIIDNKIKSRVFIAVSKRCCYLCEHFIKFAIKQGYNIVVTGEHGKIYEKNLDHYTDNLPADSDSDEDSPDPDDDGNEFMDKYEQSHMDLEKYTLL